VLAWELPSAIIRFRLRINGTAVKAALPVEAALDLIADYEAATCTRSANA
jgi:hypothetical protein